jgi:hypothetical protein
MYGWIIKEEFGGAIGNIKNLDLNEHRCHVCDRFALRLWPFKLVVSGVDINKKVCSRCKRALCYEEEKACVEDGGDPCRRCYMCDNAVRFDVKGDFEVKIRECHLCGKLFCSDCYKVAHLALCLDRKKHYISYADYQAIKNRMG